MPCPIMEANKIDQYCVITSDADAAYKAGEDYNPCAKCTWNLMNQRCGDMIADQADEAYERHRDDEACKQVEIQR